MLTEECMFKKALMPALMGSSLLTAACSDDVTLRTVGDNRQPDDVSDITGTWDLMGSVSDIGESVTGTLTISREVFILELGSVFVDYSPATAPGLVVSPGAGGVRAYNVTHAAGDAIDLGVIPMRIGGEWDADETTGIEECRAFAEGGVIGGGCRSFGGGWQYGAFRAEQLERSPSIFGDLGGTWNVLNAYEMTGGCTAILRDTTFTAHCSGTGPRSDGKITFTMQDGFGTGSSDKGLEVSAVRR
jgi:hypothetical protein